MRILISSVLIFTLLIAFSIPQDAFATTVKTVSGSGAPGCENAGGCYSPMVQFVELGDSVLFINSDNAAHTFTSGNADSGPDGEFDSGMILANYDFSHKFSNPGAYNYFCMVHPWMTGVIQVTETYVPPTSTYTPPTSTYTPPTTSGFDWQSRYLGVLSDFNDVSAKVGQLERTNQQLVVDGAAYRIESEGLREEVSYMQNTISDLNARITDLEKSVENLNAVLMEQVKVIYEWVLGK